LVGASDHRDKKQFVTSTGLRISRIFRTDSQDVIYKVFILDSAITSNPFLENMKVLLSFALLALLPFATSQSSTGDIASLVTGVKPGGGGVGEIGGIAASATSGTSQQSGMSSMTSMASAKSSGNVVSPWNSGTRVIAPFVVAVGVIAGAIVL
jgi:hypothetical protein